MITCGWAPCSRRPCSNPRRGAMVIELRALCSRHGALHDRQQEQICHGRLVPAALAGCRFKVSTDPGQLFLKRTAELGIRTRIGAEQSTRLRDTQKPSSLQKAHRRGGHRCLLTRPLAVGPVAWLAAGGCQVSVRRLCCRWLPLRRRRAARLTRLIRGAVCSRCQMGLIAT